MVKSRGDRNGEYRRIDVHAHALGITRMSYRGSGSAYVKRMRKTEGIDAIVLLGPGEMCKQAVNKFGRDFVIPVAMYRLREAPSRDLRSDMEYWLKHGCKGIKFIAPLHPYSDERYWLMYQLLVDRGATAIFHTGYLGCYEKEEEVPPIRMSDMRAAHIDTIGRRFPRLKILMSHFSNPWWEEAWKVSWSRPNIYADMSGGTAFRRSLNMWGEMYAPNGKLIPDSLTKLCFATDVFYFHNREHYIRQYIDFYEQLLDRIKAPPALRKKVWSGNARKLFGIR